MLDELELPLIPVLADLEATGVTIDRAALGELAQVFAVEIGRLEDGIFKSVGHRFTLGSPKQLEQVLFYELDLPRGKRTKTGYSTDASVLEDLRPAHPMVGMLLDWRTYTKLKSTYVDSLPLLLDPVTGRLHTTFQQAVAATGRLSSTDPNLQNIPIRTELGREIRHTFVAGDPGHVLLAADYSQIELRVLAHVVGRRAPQGGLRAARRHPPRDGRAGAQEGPRRGHLGRALDGQDGQLRAGLRHERLRPVEPGQHPAGGGAGLHQQLLRGLLGGAALHPVASRTSAQGAGLRRDALGRRALDCPTWRARNSACAARASGWPSTAHPGHRRRHLKLAMIRLHERLRRDGSRARMLLSVHDEVLLEVPRDDVTALAPVVREVMEGVLKLDVPLDVDLQGRRRLGVDGAHPALVAPGDRARASPSSLMAVRYTDRTATHAPAPGLFVENSCSIGVVGQGRDGEIEA